MNIASARLCVVFGVVQSRHFCVRNLKLNMCSGPSSVELLSMMQTLIPKLDPSLHKGEAGRIGVVGGSREYTGAPYFAAISALKVGCDLSHVFCMSEAAPVIKSYSPELIVHPILDSHNSVSDICQWLPRIHSLIVGPGLGREQTIFENTKEVILNALKMDIPIVIDADGLFYVTQYPDIVKGHRQITLTPNAMEFSRLYHSVVGTEIPANNEIASVVKVSGLLGNVTVVRKGKEDVISDGIKVLTCDHHGSHRRCGGQGDLLSGSMGTWTYWAHKAHKMESLHPLLKEYGPSLCAAFAACWLTRECSRQAFAKYHRSTITSNMIDEIGPVMTAVEENLFDEKESVSGVSQLKSSVQKGIKAKLVEQFPYLEDYINNILPKKDTLRVVKCHEHVEILVGANGELLFFRQREGPYFPSLRLLHKYPFICPWEQVDKGAIRFVLSGANIMCPGLTSPGAKLTPVPKGNVVAIMAEGKEHALAVGLTTMSTDDIASINKGVGVENIHYLNDGLWHMKPVK